jgi:hypothetical protein
MDHAAVSAELAAESFGDWLCGTTTEDEAIARYRELRDGSLRESFDECTSIGHDLSQLGIPSLP